MSLQERKSKGRQQNSHKAIYQKTICTLRVSQTFLRDEKILPPSSEDILSLICKSKEICLVKAVLLHYVKFSFT